MNKTQFIQMLKQEGYPDPVEVMRESDGHLNEHSHPFEVKALVLAGSIELVTNGLAQTYRPGEVFHLSYEQLHAETYGPEGVHYLAARRQ